MPRCYAECQPLMPIGCVGHCEILTFDYPMPAGQYELQFIVNGHKIIKDITLADGEKISVHTSDLNECTGIELRVYDDTGLMAFENGECVYEGFEFNTEIVKVI